MIAILKNGIFYENSEGYSTKIDGPTLTKLFYDFYYRKIKKSTKNYKLYNKINFFLNIFNTTIFKHIFLT